MSLRTCTSSLRKRLTLAWTLLMMFVVGCASTPERQGPVFYPKPPEQPRIQFLTYIGSEEDLGAKPNAFLTFLVGQSRPPAILKRPWEMAHEKGKLYVVDKRLQRVFSIDLASGKFDYIKEEQGGAFKNPAGIFVTADGYKYVVDTDRGMVMAFNERNQFVRTYGSPEQFRPVGIVVIDDRLYVSDLKDHEIEVLDRTSGVTLRKIGRKGGEEGVFYWPTFLTQDTEGNLYVTDFLNFRVQKFDKNESFVRAIGQNGNFPGATPRPKGIAVDREGYLYVVDTAFELVQIFDSRTGEVLLPFGKYGTGFGMSYLPSGIHIDYDNLAYFARYVDSNFRPKYLIYVANQSGPFKVNVYAFGDWVGSLPAGTAPPSRVALPTP